MTPERQKVAQRAHSPEAPRATHRKSPARREARRERSARAPDRSRDITPQQMLDPDLSRSATMIAYLVPKRDMLCRIDPSACKWLCWNEVDSLDVSSNDVVVIYTHIKPKASNLDY